MEQRLQVGMGVGLLYLGNLAGRRLQKLFQLHGPGFAELRNGTAAQFLVYRFLVNALPHISSVPHGAALQS